MQAQAVLYPFQKSILCLVSVNLSTGKGTTLLLLLHTHLTFPTTENTKQVSHGGTVVM